MSEDAEAFLIACEADLDLAEGKTTDIVPVMQIAGAQFALNGRRLVAMARAGCAPTFGTWQPISDKAKAASAVLSYGSCFQDGSDPEQAVVFWHGKYGMWIAAGPWQPFYPTHWMSLPAGPTGAA